MVVPSEQAADDREDHDAEQRYDRAVFIVSMIDLPDTVKELLTMSMR